MIIIIDLDLQQAIQGFGSRQVAPPIQVKSQDTPTMAIYFARAAGNIDLGTSPGLRFGLFGTGPNALVQQNTFNRVVDTQGRVCYVGYPNFNTAQMFGAIGTQASINCIGEIRYQTSFGTIARTADVSFIVQRSLLSETVLDTTTAAFTVPAVNANVTIAINSTSWLSAGLNLAIGAGAGAYQVVSITDATHFVAMNQGGAGNAAPATVIPSGTTVGIAATNVIQTYPDASLLELITRKNNANGYAGLNASSKLATSAIPVDGTTINFSGAGNLQLANVVATVGANFTTPASGGTVNITVSSSTAFVIGQWVRIPIAGYYSVTAVPDGTHVTLQNLGDLWNASAGTTITTGAAIVSWTSLGGGGGGAGANAFTTTTASFTQPAVAATVSVSVGSTAWMAIGQTIFIAGGGQYTVSSVTDATHVVVTNLGSSGNAASGGTVSSGATVSPSGLNGTNGTNGINAYTTTTANFTTPAAGSSVTVTVGSTMWVSVGQVLFIAGAGYYQVAAVLGTTQLSMTNLGTTYGNASGGSTVSSGASVSASGVIGPQGAAGPQGPAGAAGSGSTIYTGSSLQGNGNVATPATLVADIAQGTGAFKVYQRDLSGNSKWDVALLSAADAASAPSGGEVSQIQAQTSGVLSLKKLKAGSNITLTDQGGSTGDILIASSGGGGVDLQDPENGIEWTEHFIQPNTLGLGSTIMTLPWTTAGFGTAGVGGGPSSALVSTGAEMSAINISTGSVTGEIDLTLGNTGNGYNYCVPIGLGVCTWKCKVAIDAIITSTDALIDSIGLFRYNHTQGFYGGFFFEYNYANSANWRCCVRTGTGTTNVTYVDSGVAAAANTWVKFKVVTNAAWTSFAFYINNTLVATITTNVPTVGTDLGVAPHFLQIRTAYAAIHYIYPGYFYLNYPFTN